MKTVVLLSGGMDSTAVLAAVRETHRASEVVAVSFRYPSKHNEFELGCAANVAEYYGVKHLVVDVTSVFESFKSDLLLSGGSIPEGHYSDETMKATVVPGRNMIFLSIATGLAESLCAKFVACGIHAGDHAIYPDCRPDFKARMSEAIAEATERKVVLLAPFLLENKTSIIQLTSRYDRIVPWHLTRTCYKNQETSCGKCGSCTERLEAFQENALNDPIEYS